MRAVRAPVFMGLLVFILTAGYCAPPTGSRDARSLLELLMDRVRSAGQQQQQQQHTDDSIQHLAKKEDSIERREVNEVNKSYQHDQILEVFPRDLRLKEKVIKHLTGPLYISPKCSKHFYRLYNTRDCTIPALYRRCARLLTRLAGSQRCSEG